MEQAIVAYFRVFRVSLMLLLLLLLMAPMTSDPLTSPTLFFPIGSAVVKAERPWWSSSSLGSGITSTRCATTMNFANHPDGQRVGGGGGDCGADAASGVGRLFLVAVRADRRCSTFGRPLLNGTRVALEPFLSVSQRPLFDRRRPGGGGGGVGGGAGVSAIGSEKKNNRLIMAS